MVYFSSTDFKHDYKTLYPWFMESIWWVFRQLFVKGMVYQGVKVMPYSTACTTALSNFESGQNYKEVVDPFVIVGFPILSGELMGAQLLAWTTTPWTLPSNLALCVNPEMDYLRIKDKQTNIEYILSKSRVETVFKDASKYDILAEFKGQTLQNLPYEPLFDYFAEYSKKMNAHRVLCDGYVTEDSGTGIVHQAPYFGEDDYRVCLTNGVIRRDSEVVCPVDESGRFIDPVHDFKGQYVKDADKNIINLLKQRGKLIQTGQIKHSYPFCWRSDTPLIYKAVPSWFVRVEQMTAQLLNCSSQTYWVPDFVKEKRFGNWLRDARDWAISRNRYWGTPIPIWISPDGEEIVCIGSIAELQQYTTKPITDLHREHIDDIEIPSKRSGYPPLRRIPQVFDCWFESGSMPYAQQHYPFENPLEFENCFPADFIAEGIDQTRGWFYTLLVISTALFNTAPFKNLIANGLVLAADGQKMSKRKKNYPDPMEVVNKYGADALRLYLINSPVVRAENLRFKEEGVRDIIKDVFLPWYNAYRFLFQNVYRYVKDEPSANNVFYFDESIVAGATNIMDVWIRSFKESLVEFVAKEMKAYRLYTVVPRLTRFIDQLTNWYVRLNRRRIKGEEGATDCLQSLNVLYDVLYSMITMMAPFTPYLTELMYQRLSHLKSAQSSKQTIIGRPKNEQTASPSLGGSVHFEMMPKSNRAYIQTSVEVAVSRMQSVIELGRVSRERKAMPIKYPVPTVIVIHKDEQYLKDIKSLEAFVLLELNARELVLCVDKAQYGVKMRAEPDHKILGLRLKSDFKSVMGAIKKLTDKQIQDSVTKGYFEILNHRIELDEIRIIYAMAEDVNSKYEAHSDNDVLVLMDLTPTEDLLHEGIAREIINRIQKLKKKTQLIPTDPVVVYYAIDDAKNDLAKVAKSHQEFIEVAIKSPFLSHDAGKLHSQADTHRFIDESFDVKGATLKITIAMENGVAATALNLSDESTKTVCQWINVVSTVAPRYSLDGASSLGTILIGPDLRRLTLQQLKAEIELVFGLYRKNLHFTCNGAPLDLSSTSKTAEILSEQTVFVSSQPNYVETDKILLASAKEPFAKFGNVLVEGQKRIVILENPKGVILSTE